MRILAISSQVAFGPVGLTAAVPPLQAQGHEVLAVPTVTLSNHPGHGRPAGFRTAPEDLRAMLAALANLGALSGVEAVLTGYFASPEQVEEVEAVLVRMKQDKPNLLVLVDPVIGDEGGLYVPEAVAQAIARKLVPLARVITPNRFELAWLAGLAVSEEAEAVAAARALRIPEVIATSIPYAANMLSTMLVTGDQCRQVRVPKLARVPHGTGDMLSGLYLAERLVHDAPEALTAAMTRLGHAIAISAGTTVLDVAGALRAP